MKITLKRPKGINAGKARIKASSDGMMPMLVLRPEHSSERGPGVLWIHGGGYITGLKEMVYMSRAVDLVLRHGATVIAPGYTLATKKPYPAALDDCMRALYWMKDHSEALGFRDDQIMVGGESAGGGLCRAVCLRARDEGKVRIAFQMPLYPMIDHNDTVSSFHNRGKIWNSNRNHMGWRMYLRGLEGKTVPEYASVAERKDLSDMPPCYSFVGDGEPFFAETLMYIDRLRSAGVEAKADVFKSNPHAFDMLYPKREESRKAIEAFNEAFEYANNNFFAKQK